MSEERQAAPASIEFGGLEIPVTEEMSVQDLRDFLNMIERPEQLRAPVIVGGSDAKSAFGLSLVKASIDFEKGGPCLLLETDPPYSS